MDIAVIIPTFNRSKCLKRAIDSVLAQNYQDFKLYIVDDGSTDETSVLLENFQNHPKITIVYQKNAGVSAARNAGIKASNESWIAFLDSDDEWTPNKLQVQMDALKLHPHLRFVHSNEIWVRNGKRVNPKLKFDKSNFEIFERSLETCLISPSTVIMKRSLGEEFNFFDSQLEICEDYDLWLKILVQEEVLYLPEYLITKYGGHEDQLSLKYPAMDLWRVRSLVKLLQHPKISLTQQKRVTLEIKRKSEILLKGLIKHQQLQQQAEIELILKELSQKEN